MKTLPAALLFFLAASLCTRLDASPSFSDCVAGSLASYEAGGSNSSSCAIGGSSGGVVIIDGFLYSGPTGDDSQIQLTPDPVGLGGGFTFSDVPVAGPGETLTFDISYDYLINGSAIGTGATLGLDPPVGNVSITESICVDSSFNASFNGTACNNGDPVQSLNVNTTNPPASESAQLALNPEAMSSANVEIHIVETGGTDTSSGFDSTTSNNLMSSTPEPITILLTLAGLIAIGAFRRCRGIVF